MKTLHLYLARQVLATVFMTVLVFTLFLLLANVLKEILALLVNGQVTPFVLLRAVGLLIPYVLAFALPMGMLTATLLVFGRLSADQELTAVRASGVSLMALATPVLLLGLALSALCAWVNLDLAPRGRVAYKDLLSEIGVQKAGLLLREQQYMHSDDYTIYVGKIQGTNLQQVEIYRFDPGQNSQSWFRAAAGSYSIDNDQRTVSLVLLKAYGAAWEGNDLRLVQDLEEMTTTLTNRFKPAGEKLSDMTFAQLRGKIIELERLNRVRGPAVATNAAQLKMDLRRLDQMKSDLTMPARVQLHREVAFSFACFAFTLIGIPLAIQAHRKETMAGVAISLILVLIYYSFIILAQSLETRSDLAPHLIVWIPNFIFQAAGAVLLWRANKGI